MILRRITITSSVESPWNWRNRYILKSPDGMRIATLGLITLGIIGTILGLVSVFGTVRSLIRARMRELAIRMTLGASRWDIYRSLGRETLFGVTAGGAAGVLLAYLAVALLTSFVTGLRAPFADVRRSAAARRVGVPARRRARRRPGLHANSSELVREV